MAAGRSCTPSTAGAASLPRSERTHGGRFGFETVCQLGSDDGPLTPGVPQADSLPVMVIPDALLDDAAPLFLVMTILAVVVPSLRHRGSWRGIGAAWLVLVAGTLVIAVTHLNDWSLSCRLNVVIGPNAIGPSEPCTSTNNLPSWLVALPPLAGIVILAAWTWRHAHPLQAKVGTVAAYVVAAAAIVAVGQIDPNLALLVLVVVAIALNAWPRLQQQRAHG